ncbi:MAG: LacI family transcriptional regulator, partial [Alphaproteobacteria bacterium HGW-Alphaproteobacteria-6]
GFGNYEIAGICVPTITTINPHPRHIGEAAAGLILDALDDADLAPVTIPLAPELLIRESSL